MDPGDDLVETVYNDETATRLMLQLELKNMLPSTVPLALPEVGTTNKEYAIWRFLRVDREGSSGSAG
ncbi:MAG: hypothetical protein R3C20_03155 [Planctomycetaceae bacterium]